MKQKLLTREEFQEQVFKRDKYKCLLCDQPAVDAHHIMDRKLFPDGGYYLNNGASVCEDCHWQCELTEVQLEVLWHILGLVNVYAEQIEGEEVVLPPGFERGKVYDKWGNQRDGFQWIPGPLFNDHGVQKILKKAGKLYLFRR